MKRLAVVALACTLLLLGGAAGAETRQASIGNYYFEDDATGDRMKLVADVGDQFTFTVRQGAATPHTVEVDELDIHSGDLLLGQTYTTPPLTKVGNFNLYCRRHESRGHHARLIVRAKAVTTPKPTAQPTAAPARTSTPAVAPAVSATQAPTATPAPTPSPTLAPVGVGTAPRGSLARTPAPDSLEGLTGVNRSNEIPWTRAVWWLLVSTVPIVGVAAYALRRSATLHAAELRAAAEADAARAATKRKPPRKKPGR